MEPRLALLLPRSSVREAPGVVRTPFAFQGGVIIRHQPGMAISRRAVLRGVVAMPGALGGALGLAGCAGMAASGLRFDASAIVEKPTLLVATTRKAVNGGRAAPWYGTERGAAMTVARAKLVPPDDGRFSLASVGLVDWQIAAIEAVPRLRDLIGEGASGEDVLVYVHGFNTTFETAALDAARLSDGIKFAGETMVFSWPSKAKLLDYVYDRESAMWSRDALEQALTELIASPTGRIHIVAHSVGTMLTLEALRQFYAGREAAAERIGAVIFASPDIDIDVFKSSVSRIGPLAGKITVITSTNDRALAVSRWLAGGITRVGAAERAQLEKLGLRVIDASAQGWGIINHDLFLSNAQIRQVIRDAVGGVSRLGMLRMFQQAG
jgi:esterase/lipase superfamily enzyme